VKLAAIDIGSNAARLLINEVIVQENKVQFNKVNLVRVPLRLGFDVFETGAISTPKVDMFLHTIKAFQHLMKAYDVQHYKACATSAMRDASNASSILKKIKAETNIDIEVITGDQEAMLVYENHVADYMDASSAYLYIDVGGGSTECTLFDNGKLLYKHSFNIGTIRLLKNLVQSNDWEQMKEQLTKLTKGIKKIVAIGSGGNINKVFSLSKKKDNKPLDYDMLKQYYKDFSSLTVAERITEYHFKDDRADVIVPALEIYINAMKWSNCSQIYVPKIGVADGIMHQLYDKVSGV
jgi:exopolyphosphatase / guanosine-5'-triphosphate,3'-diphosphate pyrophosphatase